MLRARAGAGAGSSTPPPDADTIRQQLQELEAELAAVTDGRQLVPGKKLHASGAPSPSPTLALNGPTPLTVPPTAVRKPSVLRSPSGFHLLGPTPTRAPTAAPAATTSVRVGGEDEERHDNELASKEGLAALTVSAVAASSHDPRHPPSAVLQPAGAWVTTGMFPQYLRLALPSPAQVSGLRVDSLGGVARVALGVEDEAGRRREVGVSDTEPLRGHIVVDMRLPEPVRAATVVVTLNGDGCVVREDFAAVRRVQVLTPYNSTTPGRVAPSAQSNEAPSSATAEAESKAVPTNSDGTEPVGGAPGPGDDKDKGVDKPKKAAKPKLRRRRSSRVQLVFS